MNFKDFKNYNTLCPLCKNKLTLCMLIIGDFITPDRLFIEEKEYISNNILHFRLKELNNYCDLSISDKVNITFSDSLLSPNENTFIFLYICQLNQDSLVFEENEFRINAYNTCYYRSSQAVMLLNNQFIEYLPNSPILNEECFSLLNDKKFYEVYLIKNKYLVYCYNLGENNFLKTEIPYFAFSDKNNFISKIETFILFK